jgi:hypothetical protein
MRRLVVVLACLLPAVLAWAQDSNSVVITSNMKVLNCPMPDGRENKLIGSNRPGYMLLPGESLTLQMQLKKEAGTYALEIQEITTRDPEKREKTMEGFTDTGGHALIIGLEGKPILFPFTVTHGQFAQTKVEVPGVPIPERFGTYALILLHNEKRTFMGTSVRVPPPAPGGTLENTPIFGEGNFLNSNIDERCAIYERMGIHGSRVEWGWSEKQDGTTNWEVIESFMEFGRKHGIQFMVTLGGTDSWKWPFGRVQTPANVPATWNGNPYGGQCDWVTSPALYERYGKWIAEMARRTWKDGKGALWGFENYNEPWEGGGISGWARDLVEYRKLQKVIADAARSVDPRIRICGTCSVMNTEDKLYPDGSNEFDKYIDVFTDHYVVPPMCYGPMVAKKHGKQTMETETWVANSEYSLPQTMVQFLASGQDRVAPWHPRVLYDFVNGTLVPSPTVVATAAFNSLVTGKTFEKMAFNDHLPWVFQFGKDADKDGLLVVFGELMGVFGNDPRNMLWAQVNSSKGGTITINNRDRALKFFDMAGNPIFLKEKTITWPMSIYPLYIKCAKGPAFAAARLKAAKITGKRPVEILPRDFTTAVAPGAPLQVSVHNCLNRAITGTLTATTDGLTLQPAGQALKLQAGETATVTFTVAQGQPNAANAYPCTFTFTSKDGNADYKEILNAAVAPKRTITVDGDFADWQGITPIRVITGASQNEATELLRKPWLELLTDKPKDAFMEFRLAWDADNLYIAAQVRDTTPATPSARMEGRDENAYFHSAADDTREPFKSFLAKYAPGHSFGEVTYVWADSPEMPRTPNLPTIPFRRDRLQIALDVTSDWHDLTPTTDKVPYGFHAVPDTDYEYSLYVTKDGPELWRQLAPGVARIHDWPRQPKAARTTGPVPGAKFVAKLDGNIYTYELALPKAELATLKLQPGTTFGLALRGGNNTNAHADYAATKAVVKFNGLTLHPYWELSPSAGVRWTLVE